MPNDLIGQSLEVVDENVVKPVASQAQVTKIPQNIASQVAGQKSDSTQQLPDTQQQKDTQDMNKALYGKSDDQKQAGNTSANSSPTDPVNSQQKTQEDQAALEKKRQELQFHMEHYYKPTFEAKKKPEPTIQEKNEQEEQEKRIKEQKEFEEQQKKQPIKPPLAKGSGEKKLGIGG